VSGYHFTRLGVLIGAEIENPQSSPLLTLIGNHLGVLRIDICSDRTHDHPHFDFEEVGLKSICEGESVEFRHGRHGDTIEIGSVVFGAKHPV